MAWLLWIVLTGVFATAWLAGEAALDGLKRRAKGRGR